MKVPFESEGADGVKEHVCIQRLLQGKLDLIAKYNFHCDCLATMH